MRKLLLIVALVAGGLMISSSQVAKADHLSGCGPGWGGGYYSSGYGVPVYGPPVYSYGYSSYPSYGFGYARPGVSISIGSGYRGYGYGGYGYRGYGGGYRGGHHGHRH